MQKIYLLLALILCSAARPLLACSWENEEKEDHVGFFNQYIYSDKSYHMLMFCPYNVFSMCKCDESIEESNLLDWIKYLDGKPTLRDTQVLFYWSSKEDLLQLQDLLNGIKSYQLEDPSLLKNSFFVYLKEHHRTDVMQYVIYAKEQEQERAKKEVFYTWYQGENVILNDNYTDEAVAPIDRSALLEEGLKLYQAEKDPYLRARYAYQLVRGGLLSASDLEAEFGPWQDEKSYILLRAWEWVAGSFLKQGEWLLSQQIYVHVFKQLPDRRNSCMNSMRIANEEQFNALLEACNYDPVLFFIMSYRYRQPEESAIAEILSRGKQASPYLDVLMLRRLSKIERQVYRPSYYDEDSVSTQEQLQEFMKTLDDVLPVKRNEKDLWQLAKAYTYIMMREYASAQSLLAGLSVKEEYTPQLKTLKVLLKLGQEATTLNPQKIETIFHEYLSFNEADTPTPLRHYMFSVFGKYYKDHQDILRSLLCENKVSLEGNARYGLLDLDFINDLEALYKKSKKTELEKVLIQMAKIPKDAEAYFNEMRGTYYLLNFNATKAYEVLRKIPDDFKLKYYSSSLVNFNLYTDGGGYELYDPSIFSFANRHYFDSSFADRCDEAHLRCDFLAEKGAIQNKKDLARLIVAVGYKAAQNGNDKEAAYYNYLLGNVWYNLSPNGWFRRILQFDPINTTDYEQRIFQHKYDTKVAEGYYLKALYLCEDDELKAKISFCLAALNDLGDDKGKYFDQLKNKYGSTRYYQEIIKECGYFRHYVRNKN